MNKIAPDTRRPSLLTPRADAGPHHTAFAPPRVLAELAGHDAAPAPRRRAAWAAGLVALALAGTWGIWQASRRDSPPPAQPSAQWVASRTPAPVDPAAPPQQLAGNPAPEPAGPAPAAVIDAEPPQPSKDAAPASPNASEPVLQAAAIATPAAVSKAPHAQPAPAAARRAPRPTASSKQAVRKKPPAAAQATRHSKPDPDSELIAALLKRNRGSGTARPAER